MNGVLNVETRSDARLEVVLPNGGRAHVVAALPEHEETRAHVLKLMEALSRAADAWVREHAGKVGA